MKEKSGSKVDKAMEKVEVMVTKKAKDKKK